MIETIIVSAIVSFLTARVSAKIFLGTIDRYVDAIIKGLKEALQGISITPDKQP